MQAMQCQSTAIAMYFLVSEDLGVSMSVRAVQVIQSLGFEVSAGDNKGTGRQSLVLGGVRGLQSTMQAMQCQSTAIAIYFLVSEDLGMSMSVRAVLVIQSLEFEDSAGDNKGSARVSSCDVLVVFRCTAVSLGLPVTCVVSCE